MEMHIGFDGMVHLMLRSHYSKKNNDYLNFAIDVDLVPNIFELNEDDLKLVSGLVNCFSEKVIDKRLFYLKEFIDSLSDDELNEILCDCSNIEEKIMRLIDLSEEIHQIHRMNDLMKKVGTMDGRWKISLIVSKYFNVCELRFDDLKNAINGECSSDNVEYIHELRKIFGARLVKFEHDVYVVLQNNLFKRFYEFDYIKNNK